MVLAALTTLSAAAVFVAGFGVDGLTVPAGKTICNQPFEM